MGRELPFLFFSLFMKVKGERSMHTGNHPEDGQTGMIVLPYVASSDDHHCQTKDLCDHPFYLVARGEKEVHSIEIFY